MSFQDRLKEYWIDFGERIFKSHQLDLFISGLSLYSPLWFKEPVHFIKLKYVGSVSELKNAINVERWDSYVSKENHLILTASIDNLLIEFQTYDSIDILFSLIESNALNYERVCFSFRQKRFIEDLTIEKPTQMVCDRSLSFESKKDLFLLCLKRKLRLELLISSKFLGTIDFLELCQLGLFEWIENHIYVSFLLDDLYHMNVLTQESKSFIISLTSVLTWIEQNYTKTITLFENLYDEIDERTHKSLLFPYKKYLIYTSQTKFIDAFESTELKFLNRVAESFEHWIEFFEGNELSYVFMGAWINKFKRSYLEAFILSSMHIIRIYGDSKMYRHQITKIIHEYILEEKFVKNLLIKAEISVSKEQFTNLLVLRFTGELKSIHGLKEYLNKP